MSKQELYWIGSPQDDGRDAVYIFRRIIRGKAKVFTAKISADSRYKLYVNGQLASIGPLKGTEHTAYYEETDLSGYLKSGDNVIEAHVLYLSDRGLYQEPISLNSVMRRSRAVFMFCAEKDGERIVSDKTWQVCRDESMLIEQHQYAAYAALNERKTELCDNRYTSAVEAEVCHLESGCVNHYGELDTYMLQKRCIPPMFIGVGKTLLSDVMIPAGETHTFILDAQKHSTAYVRAAVRGKGTIRLTYSECFEKFNGSGYEKGARDDSDGILRGDYDEIISANKLVFDSYWFKTFRFIKLEAQAQEDLYIDEISYRKTHYPLDISAEFACSDDDYNKMHEISVRTLLNCMHETFEDCPYYEQLQYIMDTELQMLFAYQLSDDYALQKKAIADFTDSVLPCGFLQSRYPSMKHQVIPGFSLYYVYMLDEYLCYTGDLQTVKNCISVVDGILNRFDCLMDGNGLVGATGYWSFVDWVPGWENGVPNGRYDEGLTVYSMMYSKALESAAKLACALGRCGLKEEYLSRRFAMNRAIRTHCYDSERKLYRDGTNMSTYSEHCQIWAVLCCAVDGDEAKALIERTFDSDIKRCTFSMRFFTFRALEKAGMYHYADKLYDGWRKMMKQNCTTWAETPENPRSECHAWSAVMLYEFAHMILGVKVERDGIVISPYAGKLTHASGTVPTRFGRVEVSWVKNEDGMKIDVSAPGDVMEKIKIMEK